MKQFAIYGLVAGMTAITMIGAPLADRKSSVAARRAEAVHTARGAK